MAETPILRRVILACSRGAARLFRCNTGTGWVGEIVNRWSQRENGEIVRYITIKNPRPLRAGLTKGGSDTLGWRSVVITPEMVGMKIAQIVTLEVKDAGQLTPEQRQFLAVVQAAGGLAGVVRSPEQAVALINSAPVGQSLSV